MGQWQLGSGAQERDWNWREKINLQVCKWYFKTVKPNRISQEQNFMWE